MSLSYGEKYQLLALSSDEKSDKDILAKLIGNKAPGKRLLDLLVDSQCAKSAIIENDYIDLDYRSCHADQYYLSHHAPPTRCRRIHFFNCTLQLSDIFDLSRYQSNYLGFVTLRPFRRFHLGRTVLSSAILDAITPSDQQSFLTCNATYTCNIAGSEMKVVGSPWMQQDNFVAACASVSLWGSSYHMSHRFAPEFRIYDTAAITSLATTNDVAGTKQSPGLTTSQMMYALREMGFEPVIYTKDIVQDSNSATSILYNYIESGIPVILSFSSSRGNHAVVCVGHTLPRSTSSLHGDDGMNQGLGNGSELLIQATGRRLRSFIVNDDADGPFRLMSFEKPSEEDRRQSRDICKMKFDDSAVPATLHSMIVPLPNGVVIRSDMAEGNAINVLKQYPKIFDGKEIVVRTFLSLSNSYKAYWLDAAYLTNLAAIVRTEVLSRWIWVTEVSTTDLFYGSPAKSVAHLVQDPAACVESMAFLCLVINGSVYCNRDGTLKQMARYDGTLLPRMGREWKAEINIGKGGN